MVPELGIGNSFSVFLRKAGATPGYPGMAQNFSQRKAWLYVVVSNTNQAGKTIVNPRGKNYNYNL